MYTEKNVSVVPTKRINKNNNTNSISCYRDRILVIVSEFLIISQHFIAGIFDRLNYKYLICTFPLISN